MPTLPVVSGRDCIRALQKLGDRVTRQKGSHVRLASPGRPPVTVPLHGELDRGTLKAILRAAQVDVEGFLELLD